MSRPFCASLTLAATLAAACAAPPLPPVRPDAEPGAEFVFEGDALRRVGRLDEAEAAYLRALEVEPGSVEAHVGRQEIELRRGMDLELRRRYRAGPDRYLAGRLEGDPRRRERAYRDAAEPWRTLGLGELAAMEGDWEGAGDAWSRVVAADPGLAAARLALGRACYRAPRPDTSDRVEAEAVLWSDPADPSAPALLSAAADAHGDWEDAYAWALAAFRRAPAVFAERFAQVARRGSAETRAAAAEELLAFAGDGEEALLAAVLLFSAGRADAADAALARARDAGASEAEIAAARPAPERPDLARFLSAFVRGVQARYRHYAATGEAESFGEFHAWARAVYERETGEVLAPPAAPVAYSLVGEVVDATAETEEPLVRRLADQGLLLVLGRRNGGPPEALLAEVVRREPVSEARVRGAAVTREVVWTGHRHVSGYAEWAGGGELAGLALDRQVIVDLDEIARWEGGLRRRLRLLEARRDEVLGAAALPDEPVDSLEDPAGVADRIYLAAGTDLAGTVLVHEDAHLVDAERHLPVGDHPIRNLLLALSRGFRPSSILAYLERNAQLAAIAEGPAPRIALAAACAAITGDSPHARGYREIVRGFVREIVDEPSRFPAIDAERVIVQQLHLLSDDEVRALARALADRWRVNED